MSISNWFPIPVDVFIDTQVYINESYNFNKKGKLSFFCKYVREGKIVHLTSELVKKEVEKHIRKDVSEVVSRFNKMVDDRKFAIFRDKGYCQLQKINESEMVEEAILIFQKYLSDTKAFTLNTDTIDVSSVISDYFETKPPFGIKKEKKSEFPDAFNISMLRKYVEHNCPVIIVSGDRNFSNEEHIFHFETLGEVLDAISSQNKITQEVKKHIENENQYIFDEIESKLMDNGYNLEVDGTDTDRKGYQHGIEYDETELLSFSAISLEDIYVVGIDLSVEMITIALDCKAELEFSCTFIDEEFWNFYTYGRMQEIHNATIPATVNILFEDDNGNYIFDIDNIDVSISDIELNQYTLKEGIRARIDDPDRYWNDREPVNNPFL